VGWRPGRRRGIRWRLTRIRFTWILRLEARGGSAADDGVWGIGG
jgi:hypothetical protein